MRNSTIRRHRFLVVSLALAAAAAAPVGAVTITDPAGDIFPAFAAQPDFMGGPVPGGFDVLSFSVKASSGAFRLDATFDGPVSGIGTGFYVVGVDRGAGTAGFGADQPGVLFDSVIVLLPSGAGTVIVFGMPPVALDPGAVTISGNAFSAVIPFALLPSSGFGVGRYGFNLWPELAPGDFDKISDFAPDNAVLSVPEPAGWAMMIFGFGMVGGMMRRRSPDHVGDASGENRELRSVADPA